MLEESCGRAGHVEWRQPREPLRGEGSASGALGAGSQGIRGGWWGWGGAGERGTWHNATPAVLGERTGGAHFAPRRSEIHVFPLEIRVPTRPGLERLIGHGQRPRSGQAGSSR